MPIVFGSARTHIKDADLARSHGFADAEVFSTVILLIQLVNFAAVYAWKAPQILQTYKAGDKEKIGKYWHS